jgi:hypothetical protein
MATDLDLDELQAFMERYAADQAATMHAATIVVGERLGLYRALAAGGPQTADELATATGCHPRLVREWLERPGGEQLLRHDPESGALLADPRAGGLPGRPFQPDLPRGWGAGGQLDPQGHRAGRQAFTGDGGIGWDEHHADLFAGTERFFGPVYRGEPGEQVDPGARRRGSRSWSPGQGRRRGLRARASR